MGERRGRARLAQQALDRLRVGAIRAADRLQRDLAPQFAVEGAVDHAHAAPADFFQELVLAEAAQYTRGIRGIRGRPGSGGAGRNAGGIVGAPIAPAPAVAGRPAAGCMTAAARDRGVSL